jgi:hypothetical protein
MIQDTWPAITLSWNNSKMGRYYVTCCICNAQSSLMEMISVRNDLI